MSLNRYSLTSDVALNEEFSYDLKNRFMDQKHMYQGENAQNFCDMWKERVIKDVPEVGELANAFRKYIDKNKKTAIISIGCGDSSFESGALSIIADEGYNFAYFGVDSSREMLDLAEINLGSAVYPAHLIFGDFMSSIFTSEIPKLTYEYEDMIFLFLGSTLGNLSQTAAVDSLYNMMIPGGKLFLEVGVTPSLSREDYIKIFKRARDRLSDMEYMKIYFQQLEKVGIPFDHGKMVLETSKEASVGVIKVTYGFEITKKTIVDYRGEKLHLLPNEVIKLLDIRMYYHEALIQFIKEHEFNHLESLLKPRRGLFVFEK